MNTHTIDYTHLEIWTSLKHSSLLAFAQLDRDDNILEVNLAFRKLFKTASSKLRNKAFVSLFRSNEKQIGSVLSQLKNGERNELTVSTDLNITVATTRIIEFQFSAIYINNIYSGAYIFGVEKPYEKIIRSFVNLFKRYGESNFFDHICIEIRQVLDVPFIGIFDIHDETFNCLSFYCNDQLELADAIELPQSIKTTLLDSKQNLIYYKGVQEHYPDCQLFRKLEIQSFIAYPFSNKSGEIIGFLCMMDSNALTDLFRIEKYSQFYKTLIGFKLNEQVKEQKLTVQKEFANSIFLQSPIGILMIEDSSSINPNPAFCKFLGYSKEELMKLTIRDISHPDDIETRSADFQKLLRGELNYVNEIKRYITKTGQIVWGKVLISPLHDSNGKVVNHVAMIENITEKVERENQLIQKIDELEKKQEELNKYAHSNEQLAHFAHIASHDLKEPLRSIGSFIQLLNHRLKGKLNIVEQEFMGFILSGVKNMNQLINDLLEYSKIGQDKFCVEEVDLDDILFIVLRSLDTSLNESQAIFEAPAIPKFITGNKHKIKQLFQNLVENALKFRDPSRVPKIIMRAESKADFWEFSISDNGIGIAEEYQERVFQLFQKLHTKEEYEGTGIGLALCYRIVEMHGGRMWMNSKPGTGTTIFFTLLKAYGSKPALNLQN